MEAIVFGTGKAGREALPYLEKQYHILFCTDNDEEKQGTMLEKYPVKSPEEIKKHGCIILITSTKYGIEIAEQLRQMGIEEERIYLCRRFQADDTYEYEAYPIDAEKIPCTSMPLIQYDLYHREEQETGCKKVLVFCLFYSVYAKQLIENMAGRYEDIEFSLLTNAKESGEKIASEHLKHIYYFCRMTDLKSILEQLPMYDAMQLLWMEREWAFFYKLIRKKSRRLNLHMGGSDFYRSTDKEKNIKKGLINCADCVVVQTEETGERFSAYYGKAAADKMIVLPYGIEVLELIRDSRNGSENSVKMKYNIPLDKIVITCGHNANEAHQHMKMIEALKQLPEHIKKQIVCVFPMTYPKGYDAYIQCISKSLKNSGLSHVILKEFMNFQEMAEYALISDIMIHVQTTDQLSSAMLEEMYAGTIVIAGKWLPYRPLHEKGIFFLDVEDICNITEVLVDVVTNIEEYKEKCTDNTEIVWMHSSWDELAVKWRNLWN